MKKFGEILAIIGGLAGLLGIWFSYQTFIHDAGGELTAWHQKRELHNNTARTVFVCLDEINTDLSSLQVTPFFDNSSKYSIKDFALTYTVESSNVVCEPTGFYTKIDYNAGKSVFRYNFETLKPYTDTEPPFRNFKVRSRQARCMIETKATYDGADYPYVYNMDVWFLVVDRKNISEENWRLSCKKAIFEVAEDKEYDIYYFGGGQKDYVFDVNLANVIAEEGIVSETKPENNVEQKSERKVEERCEEPKPTVSKPKKVKEHEVKAGADVPGYTATMPFVMRKVDITSFEFLKGDNGELSILRVFYEPEDQGASAIFAWKFVESGGRKDFGTTIKYLPPASSSCDIELYGTIASVKDVVQVVSDASIEPVLVEKDSDRAEFVRFTNPNRRPVCVYRYDKAKNQISYTTVKGYGKRLNRYVDVDVTEHSYETYLIPIKPSVMAIVFRCLLLILILAMVVFMMCMLAAMISDYGGREDLGGIITIILCVALAAYFFYFSFMHPLM